METIEHYDRADDDPIPADEYMQYLDAVNDAPCLPNGPRCTWEHKMCSACNDLFDIAFAQGERDFACGVGIIAGATAYQRSLHASSNPQAVDWYGQGWGTASATAIVHASRLPHTAFRLTA